MEKSDAQVNGSSEPLRAPDAPTDELPAWAQGWLTLEDLRRMAEDDNPEGGLELKDFIGELEAIAKESSHGR